MDGIDAALLETDGTSSLIRPIEHIHIDYDSSFRTRLRATESTVHRLNGLFSQTDLADIALQSTQWHATAIEILLQKASLSADCIDVIGYHGQTLLHRPKQGVCINIGEGQLLADLTGIPVINDFRSADIAAGGQGAPLAPLFHQALAERDGYLPVAIVNCGGIANITLIGGSEPSDIQAFDTGPGNALIDRLIRERTNHQEFMDTDGHYGLRGVVHSDVLRQLHEKAIWQDGKNFLQQPPPKSLDTHDMTLPSCLDALSPEDAAATLEMFTAETIVNSLLLLDRPMPAHWILAGGGWHNPVILRSLTTLLQKHLGEALILETADTCGWSTQAMEAQLFAWLAVRSLKGLPLSIPETTGVSKPLTGGCHYTPFNPPKAAKTL